MKKFKIILREIANYIYLRKTIDREFNNPDSKWHIFKLRKNWYYRMYTIISLREEDMGEEEVVRNWKAMEMMRSINDYFTSLDLHEIIFPSIEKIPDSRSYLVVYSPLFKELTIGWVLWRLFYLVGILSFICILINRFLF